MLMSHVSAMLRTLISIGLPLGELLERTSRILCESTLPTHYATLACGRLSPSGEIEICNAGHPPPLVISGGGVRRVEATALPVGMFCSHHFSSRTLHLAPGETLMLYTDGLIEASNEEGDGYGLERLCAFAESAAGLEPTDVIRSCLGDLEAFRGGPASHGSPESTDDLTIMAVRRA
jgi:sigma-B regulation protein RsbU (phosphoserine phosphatase)